jgi:hypothetical protein
MRRGRLPSPARGRRRPGKAPPQGAASAAPATTGRVAGTRGLSPGAGPRCRPRFPPQLAQRPDPAFGSAQRRPGLVDRRRPARRSLGALILSRPSAHLRDAAGGGASPAPDAAGSVRLTPSDTVYVTRDGREAIGVLLAGDETGALCPVVLELTPGGVEAVVQADPPGSAHEAGSEQPGALYMSRRPGTSDELRRRVRSTLCREA